MSVPEKLLELPATVRLATGDDIPALRDLIERSVRSLQANDYNASQIEGALGTVLGLDTQLVRDRTYFVASILDGDVSYIAACGGWSMRRTLFGSDHGPYRADEFLDPSTDAAKIRAIFVDPRWARRGLGSLILKTCEDAAVQAGFSRFEMGSTLTGVRLYSLRGYVERVRIQVPLSNGEFLPVVKMEKFALQKPSRLPEGN